MLGMDAAPEATRVSNSRMCEEMDAGAEAMSRGSSSEGCLSFVSTGVCQMKRGSRGRRERTCVAIDSRIGGRFHCGYMCSCLYC